MGAGRHPGAAVQTESLIRPTVEMLLRLCWVEDLQLTDVLNGHLSRGAKPRAPLPAWMAAPSEPMAWAEVESLLVLALETEPALSLKSVMIGVHRSPETVAAHFPHQVEAIKKRHAAWTKRAVAAHRADQDEAIATAVRELAMNDIGPSRRKVQALTGTPIRKRLMGVWQVAVRADATAAVPAPGRPS